MEVTWKCKIKTIRKNFELLEDTQKFDKKPSCALNMHKNPNKSYKENNNKRLFMVEYVYGSGEWDGHRVCLRQPCRGLGNWLHSLLIPFWAVAVRKEASRWLTRTSSMIRQPQVLNDSSKERRFKIRQRVHTRTLIYCCLKKINISESFNTNFSRLFFRHSDAFSPDCHWVTHVLTRIWLFIGTGLKWRPIELITCFTQTGSSTEQEASYVQESHGPKIQLFVRLPAIILSSQLLPSGFFGIN